MNLSRYLIAFLLLLLTDVVALEGAEQHSASQGPAIRKIKDMVIYRDDTFYSSFPSIVKRPDGELLVAFRRAPDRRRLGDIRVTHTDPNSYLEMVRSADGGQTWSAKPELIYANPFGGSQDPCMVQLSDHSILCTSYGWAYLRPEAAKTRTNLALVGGFAFLGGYILRSADGHHWDEPIVPPAIPQANACDLLGRRVAAYNRGAMCEGKNGQLFWVVANSDISKLEHTATYLLISPDKGRTWNYSCPVAEDDKVAFNETSIYETPKGDLVAFLRTENFGDHTAIARSTNGGKSFGAWQDAGFMGHPHYALRLPDKRVLLVYGYRHAPFGVRARVLDPECTNASTAPEIVLRDDGGGGDLGYPWATMLSKHRALVVYYFNQKDSGPRYIAGTELEIE